MLSKRIIFVSLMAAAAEAPRVVSLAHVKVATLFPLDSLHDD
jgi:hypothetical protein